MRAFTDPLEGQWDFKYIVSLLVIQVTAILIIMLKRTLYLGELIQMLTEMVGELVRFFTTFGVIILLFLLIGRFLSEQLQEKIVSYWQMFLELFDAFNGKPYFSNFTVAG